MEKFNHYCHFQNRLRHHDFIKLFKDMNLKIYFEKAFYENNEENIEVSKEFNVNLKTTYATSDIFTYMYEFLKSFLNFYYYYEMN